jgi:hypothetical protein
LRETGAKAYGAKHRAATIRAKRHIRHVLGHNEDRMWMLILGARQFMGRAR